MNSKAEDAANKIMLAFQSGGVAPLEPEKLAQVREHVRSILNRAMENRAEKKKRKWTGFHRAVTEHQQEQPSKKDGATKKKRKWY